MVMMTKWTRNRDTRRLVLTRKVNEEILIGDDIRLTIIRSRDGRVKLAIEAPADVKVMRSELIASASETETDIPK
jgi:carbon storage regulator